MENKLNTILKQIKININNKRTKILLYFTKFIKFSLCFNDLETGKWRKSTVGPEKGLKKNGSGYPYPI